MNIPTNLEGLFQEDGPVIIPSNTISMRQKRGKRKLPKNVLAIPDGQDKSIIMENGQEYEFPLSENVLEIPILKKGGNWIPKNLKKGRCTPAPNPDCPVGSPQYNLAQTFKRNHGFHKKQEGGEISPENVDNILLNNTNKNFVNRYVNRGIFPVMNNEDGTSSTLKMESSDNFAYPTIIQNDKGQLVDLHSIPYRKNYAYNQAMNTGEFLQFPTDEQANWFAENGYKTGNKTHMQAGGSVPPYVANDSNSGIIPNIKRKFNLARGQEQAMEDSFNDVIVYGTKDKQTRDYLNHLSGKDSKNPEDFSRYNYRQVWNSWKDNGKPDIRLDNPKITHFNPITNTIHMGNVNDKGLNKDYHDYSDYISELAHARQLKRDGLLSDLSGFAKDWVSNPYFNRSQQLEQYNIPGTSEYEAHTIIEPKLKYKYNIKLPRIIGSRNRMYINRNHMDWYNNADRGYNDEDRLLIKVPELKYGGNISPEKAKEMLHNPPHGKKLTEKQRKYFGWLSNQKKQLGGEHNNFIETPSNFQTAFPYTPQQNSLYLEPNPVFDINQLFYNGRIPEDATSAPPIPQEEQISQLNYQNEFLPQKKREEFPPFNPAQTAANMRLTRMGLSGLSNKIAEDRELQSMLEGNSRRKYDNIQQVSNNVQEGNLFGYKPMRKGGKFQAGGNVRKQLLALINEEDDDEETNSSKKQTEEENTAPSQSELNNDIQEQDNNEEEYNNLINDILNSNYEEGEGINNEEYSNIPTTIPQINNTQEYQTPNTNISSPKGGNDKMQYAFNYLQSKGIAPHVAAGIVGNLQQESSLNPKAAGDKNKRGEYTSFGLPQWHGERWNQFNNWATQNSLNPHAIETQLDYVVLEAQQRGDLDKTAKATNSEEAANIFAQHYERPKRIDRNRAHYAKQLYKNGGNFKKGRMYDISQEEYDNLIKQGYKLKTL